MTDVERSPDETVSSPDAPPNRALEGASLPEGFPAWFDPTRDAILTPRRLRGLVHPIRLRLLTMLQEEGPATASQLGRRIGHSSGVTSYHLRILADHGFVEEDTERGNGRDRYWRARYRQTSFTFRSPDDPGDEETVELAEQYMRMVLDASYARMVGFVESIPERRDELPTLPWTFHDTQLRLTHDEARALSTEVSRLLLRYRRESSATENPAEAVDALFMFQMLPDDGTEKS